jgi:hypothetical protein
MRLHNYISIYLSALGAAPIARPATPRFVPSRFDMPGAPDANHHPDKRPRVNSGRRPPQRPRKSRRNHLHPPILPPRLPRRVSHTSATPARQLASRSCRRAAWAKNCERIGNLNLAYADARISGQGIFVSAAIFRNEPASVHNVEPCEVDPWVVAPPRRTNNGFGRDQEGTYSVGVAVRTMTLSSHDALP